MRRVLLRIGTFQINTFGFFIALGMLTGLAVGYREAKRRKMADEFLDFSTWALILGLVGARLAFVLTSDPVQFIRNPVEILRVDLGGLSIHGAIFGGIVAGAWFSRRRKISFWRLADVVVPGLVLAQAIGRIGCDVFGYAMAKPGIWGVNLDGVVLHPVQLYESLLDYAIFAFLWSRRDKTRYDGQLFVEYTFLFSLARGFVEFFRINPLVWGPFSIAHVASLGFAIAAIAIHVWLSPSRLSRCWSSQTRLSHSLLSRARLSQSSILSGEVLEVVSDEATEVVPNEVPSAVSPTSPWFTLLGTAALAILSIIVYYAFPPA